MKRDRRIAGLGGVVFGALVIVALSVANPQAGSYHVADVSAFVAQGHRNAAVLSSALIAIAVFGLIALMAYLCDTYLEEGHRNRIAWGSSLLAGGSILIGWMVILTPSVAVTFGGGPALDPAVTYTFIEAGLLIFLVGGLWLGVALLGLAMFGHPNPTWARVLTGLVGVLALFSVAFEPFLAVLVWGFVVGIWLLATSPETDVAVTPSYEAG